MNVLILTANGREHALALTYAKSKKVKKVIMIPGNGLTASNAAGAHSGLGSKIKNYPDVKVEDFEKILQICKKEQIDFVDVSQDEIIAKGYVDKFQKEGIETFGPTKRASQIEWDKAWAREFMKKYGLPIPKYETFSDTKKAEKYVNKFYNRDSIAPLQNDKTVLFVKASGLAGGKGVIKAESKEQAIDAIQQMKQFKKSGETFVIEQELKGEEFSLFALCDGKNYQILQTAQDHKTVYNNNTGPNTGGMGCIAPTGAITPSIIRIIEKTILTPFIKGMEAEGRPYQGVLYLGGMITSKGIKIIEFNARWGDPEAEVILPGIKTDYVDVITAVKNQKLHKTKITLDRNIRISIAGCALGYPQDFSDVKGKEIFGLSDAMKITGVTIFGAGITRKEKRFFVNGGRIFHLVAKGKNIKEARKIAYEAMSLIFIEGNNLHYRTDIGWQELEKHKY